MIQVIATIELKPACREDFLSLLNDNVPKVKAAPTLKPEIFFALSYELNRGK